MPLVDTTKVGFSGVLLVLGWPVYMAYLIVDVVEALVLAHRLLRHRKGGGSGLTVERAVHTSLIRVRGILKELMFRGLSAQTTILNNVIIIISIVKSTNNNKK